MDILLDVEGLSKIFGPITAVDQVSFQVARGEVLGFLGPNGAGKSTTMKMIAGYLLPNRGRVQLAGFDVVGHRRKAQERLGYLPEGAPLYGDMTAQSLLAFVASIRGLTGAQKAKAVETAIQRLDLGQVRHQPIDTLSKGFKRRVGLAQSILHDPQVLILDEPTDGLDPNQKHDVRRLLQAMAGDKTIVISTHILEEVEAVCSRAIIIAAGKIVADETPAALQARSGQHNALELRFETSQAERAQVCLRELTSVAKVECLGTSNGQSDILALPQSGRSILGPVREVLRLKGIPLTEIRQRKGRMEDVFRDLTRPGQGTN